MTDDEIAELRRTAENPLARPSERVAARRRLVELGEVPAGRVARGFCDGPAHRLVSLGAGRSVQPKPAAETGVAAGVRGTRGR